MRRMILAVLLGALAMVVAARAEQQPETAAAAMDIAWDGQFYNVLDRTRTVSSGTAGSSLLAEADRYFLSRTPTAKHAYTGLLAGKNLILLLAENWEPAVVDAAATPMLSKLWDGGAHFTEMYAPDWYQGADGREFALLSGLAPTTIRGDTAMVWTGRQNTRLPFALACCLGAAGYDCRAYPAAAGLEASYAALGFAGTEPAGDGAVGDALAALAAGDKPFFAYYVLTGTDGEPALARLWQAMEAAGLTENTAVCLMTGHPDPLRGHLFLWGPGLESARVGLPCSDIDVTPTLLDLFGAAYDARFLSGRDMLSPELSGPAALVSLYGSAYSDWVTDEGCYLAASETFFPAEDRPDGGQETKSYVRQMCQAVYDRYAYAHQVLESDYFRAAGVW